MNQINKCITGKIVRLRDVTVNDIDDIIFWRNNNELNRYLNSPEKLTYEEQFNYIQKYYKKNEYYFIVELRNTKKKIGTVSIYNIDKTNKSAEFGRLIIIEQYRMCAFEVGFLALKYAFKVLKLKKVSGYCVEENTTALKYDLGLGFKIISKKNDSWRNNNGVLHGMIYLEMDKKDFDILTKKYDNMFSR